MKQDNTYWKYQMPLNQLAIILGYKLYNTNQFSKEQMSKVCVLFKLLY
jgi:hypothetical protein